MTGRAARRRPPDPLAGLSARLCPLRLDSLDINTAPWARGMDRTPVFVSAARFVPTVSRFLTLDWYGWKASSAIRRDGRFVQVGAPRLAGKLVMIKWRYQAAAPTTALLPPPPPSAAP